MNKEKTTINICGWFDAPKYLFKIPLPVFIWPKISLLLIFLNKYDENYAHGKRLSRSRRRLVDLECC